MNRTSLADDKTEFLHCVQKYKSKTNYFRKVNKNVSLQCSLLETTLMVIYRKKKQVALTRFAHKFMRLVTAC